MLAVADELPVLTVATAVFNKQMELLGLSKTDVCESVEAKVVVTAVVDLDLTSVEVGGLLVEGGGLPVEGELPVVGGVLLLLVLQRHSKIMHIILYATDAVKLHHFYGFMELCTVYTVT